MPTAIATEHPVSPDGVATDLPLVVVVDGTTASSSEIVSGALQDAGRAKIVGETTFGTGTVLGEFTLSDGSALRIGTVEWLTPEGRRIWHEGIAPDVPVTLPDGVVPLTPDDVRELTPAEVDVDRGRPAGQGARGSSRPRPSPSASAARHSLAVVGRLDAVGSSPVARSARRSAAPSSSGRRPRTRCRPRR